MPFINVGLYISTNKLGLNISHCVIKAHHVIYTRATHGLQESTQEQSATYSNKRKCLKLGMSYLRFKKYSKSAKEIRA